MITATNPQTGERIAYVAGKWVPLPGSPRAAPAAAPEEPSAIGRFVTGPAQRFYGQAKEAVGASLGSLGAISPETAGEYVVSGRQIGSAAPRPVKDEAGLQQIGEAPTAWEGMKTALRNPAAVATVAAESIPYSAPSLILGALGSLVGGRAGLAVGLGAGSYATEYASTLADVIRGAGGDPNSPEDVALALRDQTIMAQARERAKRRAMPVGAFDALSGGLAGLLVSGATGIGSFLGRSAGELATQAGLGAAGEAGAQSATGESKPGQVVLEGIAEIPGGVVETGIGAASRSRRPAEGAPAAEAPATRPTALPAPTPSVRAPEAAAAAIPPELAAIAEMPDTEAVKAIRERFDTNAPKARKILKEIRAEVTQPEAITAKARQNVAAILQGEWVPLREDETPDSPIVGYVNERTGEQRTVEQHKAGIETPLSGLEPVLPAPEEIAAQVSGARQEATKAVPKPHGSTTVTPTPIPKSKPLGVSWYEPAPEVTTLAEDVTTRAAIEPGAQEPPESAEPADVTTPAVEVTTPFTPNAVDTETGQPVEISVSGQVRTVRYEDGTTRQERAARNAERYGSLAEPAPEEIELGQREEGRPDAAPAVLEAPPVVQAPVLEERTAGGEADAEEGVAGPREPPVGAPEGSRVPVEGEPQFVMGPQRSRTPEAKQIAERFLSGEPIKNINEARRIVGEMRGRKIAAGTPEAKEVDEVVELAGVLAGRQAVRTGKSPADTFDHLRVLQDRMPTLGTRTSGSVERQAYSTPLPIAYVASRFAGIADPRKVVYEPTAGNGALLLEAAPSSVRANELDNDRARSLEGQGFRTTQDDASEFEPKGYMDVVIANPPFGAVRDEAGKGKRWPIKDGDRTLFETPDIDQAIAWRALGSMRETGRGVLILGAPNEKLQDRRQGYIAGAKQKFYYALYDKYRVAAHYTLSGDLYAKQGAGWPVDLIVIDGKGKSSRPLPAKEPPRFIATWDELKGLLDDVDATYGRPGGADAEGESVAGGDPGQAGGGGDQGALAVPGAAGRPGDVDAGPGGRTGAADGGVRPTGVRADEGPGRDSERDREPGVRSGAGSEGGAPPAAESRPAKGRAGKAPGDTTGGVGSGAGALGELNDLDSSGIDALLDDALEQSGVGAAPTPPPLVKVRPGPPPRKGKPKAEFKPRNRGKDAAATETTTAVQDLTDAGKEAAAAIDSALTGLFKLSGGGTSTLSSGFIFNEETYRAAIPAFKAALAATIRAGEKLQSFAVKVFRQAQAAAMPAEWIRTVLKPMLSRFMRDVQSGDIKVGEDEQAKPRERQPAPEVVATDLQMAYSPRSTDTDVVGTLIPINMAQGAREAFEAFEAKHGPVDSYVSTKLGYPRAKLADYFSGEQVDALALAIATIDAGTGFVIGDQTGVGKGRVNAAIIRYAKRSGRTPIFVTEKPNLYSDMVRDLTDIGMPGFRPFLTNSNLTGTNAIETPDGRKLTTPADHKRNLFAATRAGKLVDADGGEYDAIFTTYNQLQEVKKARTPRHDFVERFLPNGVLILDESHNAGGSGKKDDARGSKKNQGTPRSEIIREYVGKATAAFYSSATYAKRPDSMSLYYKTDLRIAVPDFSKIDKLFTKGGVALQQVLSSMLTKAGQYLRRERSFEGVEFSPKPFPVRPEFAEQAAEAMREIVTFENDWIKPLISGIKKDTAGEGSASGGDASQISSTNFTSLMHNVIDQMLLALKAEYTAQEAISALENGEKPVIAVANTMGAMIEELVGQSNLKPGDRIDFTFKDVMLRYLERTRWYTEGDPYGKKTRVYITDEELGSAGVAAYKVAQNTMRDMDFAGLPGSPIDYLISTIEAAGYKVGEITGRSATIDYSNPQMGPIYRMRPAAEKSKGAVVRNIGRFNGGTKAGPLPVDQRLDVMILNQSGATGLSLHASEKFGDQRRRRMIIAQSERNIDTFMQMLGRVHRTGQVVAPAYTLAVADIPAEKRPAAVLLKKMASLNANTTASAEGNLDVGDLPDFMNDVGDEVAASVMEDDMELWTRLGMPIKFSEKSGGGFEKEEAMRKVTGRIPLLPVAEQEEIYQRLQEEYESLVERKKAMGENVGGADTLDLGAKTLKRTKVFEAVGDSPFSQPAYLEQMDIKRIGKPYTTEQAKRLVDEGKAGAPDVRAVRSEADAYIKETLDRLESGAKKKKDAAEGVDLVEKLARERARLEGYRDRLVGTLRDLPVGQELRMVAADGMAYYGVVTKIERKGKAKNPAALGQWRVTLAVADPIRQLTIPFSQIDTPATKGKEKRQLSLEPVYYRVSLGDGEPSMTVMEMFDARQSGSREKRYMVTGNVFAGFNQFKGKGQIAFYTDADGVVRQGVLMPRNFKGEEEVLSQPQEVAPSSVVSFIEQTNSQLMTADRELIAFQQYGTWYVTAPKSKSHGARYFTNKPLIEALGQEFVSSGDRMVVKLPDSSRVPAVAQVIGQQFGALYAFKDQKTARAIQGLSEPTTETVEAKLQALPQRSAVAPPAVGETIRLAANVIAGNLSDPSWRWAIDQMVPELKALAKRLAGDRARLEVFDTIRGVGKEGAAFPVTGVQVRDLIAVAILDGQRSRTLEEIHGSVRHETIHLLKESGVIPEPAWKALEAKAPEWRRMLGIDADQFYGKLSEAARNEEAIAEAFARWARGELKIGGAPQVGFRAIKRFLDALRGIVAKVLGLPKLPTPQEVFEAIERGDFARPSDVRDGSDTARLQTTTLGRGQLLRDIDQAALIDEMGEQNAGLLSRVVGPAMRGRAGAYLDRARRVFQDRFIYVRRTQEEAERMLGRPVGEDEDVYRAEELFHGKVQEQKFRVDKDFKEPIVDAMHNAGLSLDEIDDYLTARHAEERNEAIAEINPKFPDGGSGMTNEEAQRILDGFNPEKRRALDQIGELVDQMMERRLTNMVDSGIISAQEADAYRSKYRHYVPLRGKPADPDGNVEEALRPIQGRGFMGSSKREKRALGRGSRAENVLATAFTLADEAIVRGEKNRVGQALLNLALAAPDPAVWTVNPVEREAYLVRLKDGRQQVRYRYRPTVMGQDIVNARVDGRQFRVQLKDADLLRAMANLGGGDLNAALSAVGWITQKLSKLNTMWSPEFVVANAFMDFQTGLVNLGREEQAALRREVTRHWLDAFKGAKGYLKDGKADTEWKRLAQEFRQNGGQTAFNQLADVETQARSIEDMVRHIADTNAQRVRAVPRRILQGIELWNTGVDNAVRLSAYAALRGRGYTPARAASVAKNLTVNFNRKGEWGPALNALTAFYNAGAQGTAVLGSAILRSPTVRKWVAGIIVAGALQELMGGMFDPPDDDEDELGLSMYDRIPEWEKKSNIIIPYGTEAGEYVKIRMPYGYNFFHNLGRLTAAYLRGAKEEDGKPVGLGKTIAKTMRAFSDAIVPPGLSEGMVPTVAQPFVDILKNEDYFGSPIQPTKFPGDEKPDSQNYYPSVNPVAREIAGFLNRITGGNEFRPGLVDVSPESLMHVLQTYAGAAGALVTNTVSAVHRGTAEALGYNTEDPSLDLSDVPFARKFFGTVSPWQRRDITYQRLGELEVLADEAKVDKTLAREHRRELALVDDARKLRRELSAMRKKRRQIQNDEALSIADRRGKVDRIDEREREVMAAFNRRYIKAIAPPWLLQRVPR